MSAVDRWIERPPQPGETCVFSQSEEMWRRDALLFDRVYAPLVRNYVRARENFEPPDIPMEFSFSSAVLDDKIGYSRGVMGNWSDHLVPPEGVDFEEVDLNYKIMAEQELELQYRYKGIMGIWCASERGLFMRRFSAGETNAYQGALNNIPVVSADVGWDQVSAFREDPDAVRKYRDWKLWLADGLKASSEQHATDLIAQRIEDYRWAIRKHGLRTMTGALSNLWDWKQSVALAAGVGTAATVGNVVVAALVAGLAVTSGVSAFFAERKISKIDLGYGGGREVAILVDIQDRFGKSAAS